MQGKSGRGKAESGNDRNAACFLEFAQQRFGRGVKRSAPQRAHFHAQAPGAAINLIAGAPNSR
jgi:hypothetical protein